MSHSRKVPARIIERAGLLRFYGKTFAEIAKKLGYSTKTFARYAQSEEWDNDKLPSFTFDDLLEDFENLLFILLQEEIKKARKHEEIDLVRMSMGFKNLVSLIKELSALAPLISSKFVVENTPKIIEDLSDKLTNDQRQQLIAILEDYAETARRNVAGIQEEMQ